MLAELLIPRVALHELARSLRSDFEQPESLRQSLGAEVVRSYLALCGNSRTSELTNRLRAACSVLFGDLGETDARSSRDGQDKWPFRVIQTLLTLGDISQAGSVYQSIYAPTPIRLVRVAEGQSHALVAGGHPTALIERYLGARVECAGYSRYVRTTSLPENVIRDDSRWQDVEDWLGIRERSLSAWTANQFVWAQATSSFGPPQGAEDIEIYVPEKGKHRWVRLSDMRELPTGMRFGRCRIAAIEYPSNRKTGFLGILRMLDGEIIVSRSAVLDSNASDRMTFGIDMLKNAQIQVGAELTRRSFKLLLLRRLPSPENKILSLGLRASGNDGDRRENRTFEFPTPIMPIVAHGLGRLGIHFSSSSAS